jgi:hypothetical protein
MVESDSIIVPVSEAWHGTFGGERRPWFAARRARGEAVPGSERAGEEGLSGGLGRE